MGSVQSVPSSGTAAANTAVTLTIAAVAGKINTLTMLCFSYSAAPTSGLITVKDGATTILNLDIASSGVTNIPLPPGGITATAGNAMTITLGAAGSTVVGKLNAATYVM